MGLDMYAFRRHYVKQLDHEKPEERHEVTVTKGGQPLKGINPKLISIVTEDVMYWRKANHIHRWFVEHVQQGTDDCGEYEVSRKNLSDLLNLCELVIGSSKLVEGQVYDGTVFDKENLAVKRLYVPGQVIEDSAVAEELLPRQSGFFFGSQEYDQDYLEDIKDTHDWCLRMINDQDCDHPSGDIFYTSSW